jgi:ribosomal protein L11 methyltransferase
MRWHEVTIHTTEEAIEMITNFVHELGAGGVSIEESGTLNKKRDTSLGQWYEKPLNDIPEGRAVIKGYFSEGTDMETTVGSLKESIVELSSFDIDTGNPVIEQQDVDDEDWANAWKQYFKPLRISERLTIKPTWEEYEASPGELIIELDPGMAFGTGTHATTALCLRTLEKVIGEGDDVIDVGTGSGVLAIAAARLGARHVLALDLDPVAVSSANENARLNGLDDRITVRQSDLLEAIGAAGRTGGGAAQKPDETPVSSETGVRMPVQVVVANILAEILLLFMDDVYKALAPGGIYVASGIITSKEEVVVRGLEQAGFQVKDRFYEGDWVAITAGKR